MCLTILKECTDWTFQNIAIINSRKRAFAYSKFKAGMSTLHFYTHLDTHTHTRKRTQYTRDGTIELKLTLLNDSTNHTRATYKVILYGIVYIFV